MGGLIIAAVIVVLVLILILTNVQVVQQSKAYVIERLGAFQTVWGTGPDSDIPRCDQYEDARHPR